MEEYEIINPETWNRKEHFYFFKQFEEPFTGLVTDVDVSNAIDYCKTKSISFFKYYLHKSICAVNRTAAFRLRIINDEIRRYAKVHASATISRTNGTFGFSHIIFDENLDAFSLSVEEEKKRIEGDQALFPPVQSDSVVHYSSMPWIKFTGISHARSFSFLDCSPKISFGKVHIGIDNKKLMPVSVHVHHALVDGKDIAEYFDHFQSYLDTP